MLRPGSAHHRKARLLPDNGWSAMFSTAFQQSRNPMILLDGRRRIVDANGAFLKLLGRGRDELVGTPMYRFVVGGPRASPKEWDAALAGGDFTGETELHCADGSSVAVQWGAHPEAVTGDRLVLFVSLSTSRWGARFRRAASPEPEPATLSDRERQIVRLVALGSTGPEIAPELPTRRATVRPT